MSDYGENTTTPDYSAYYEDTENYAPCNNSSVRNFSHVFLPTLYSLVTIIGFIGNGLVVCVLLKHRNQTTLTDICLLNLALFDLLFVFSLPFYSHYAAVEEWIFGDFVCHFASGVHTLGFFGSIFFMVVMTLDRYVVIMHAHTMARHRTLRVGIALTVVVWMLSLCISLPVFALTQVKYEDFNWKCNSNTKDNIWDNFNIFMTNIVGLVIPLLVMIFCYSRIIPTLVKMRTVKKHRIVKLIIIIVVIFFLFWTPYNIVILLNFLHNQGILINDCDMLTGLNLSLPVTEGIAYAHCCLNPIIYAFVGQKFMLRVKRLLRKWVPCRFLVSPRNMSESSFRKSSIVSRSSEITSTRIM
ncbi:C-C chemokine receptor type 5-like [Myripristis murdjan]|uniref:C-C chemokine receptor type 5-like n=1 Tax=Myripristis murdjan TaxID=586833 RepID=UPI001175D9F3|nr:C-C chemokine receptor type 5-like [Myripristis murdjan]